jgi:hypothetical protein
MKTIQPIYDHNNQSKSAVIFRLFMNMTPDSRGPCSVVVSADLRELIQSELSRMNEIKFSLISIQMSDSVLD